MSKELLINYEMIEAIKEKITLSLDKYSHDLKKNEAEIFEKGVSILKCCVLEMKLQEKDEDTTTDEVKLNSILLDFYNELRELRLDEKASKRCRSMAASFSHSLSNAMAIYVAVRAAEESERIEEKRAQNG